MSRNSSSKTAAGIIHPQPLNIQARYLSFVTAENYPRGADEFLQKQSESSEHELLKASRSTGSWRTIPNSSTGNPIIPVLPEIKRN